MKSFDVLLLPHNVRSRSAAHLLRICVICEKRLDEIVFRHKDDELAYLLSAVCPDCGEFLVETYPSEE